MFTSKTISSFFLLIITAIAVFAGSLLQLQQLHAKHNMEKMLEEKHLTTISNLTKDQYSWVEAGKEMRINGKMFDVKEIHINKDGSITVTGLFDEKEQAVLQQLAKKEDNKNNNSAHNIFSQIFSSILALPQQGYLLHKIFSYTSKRQFIHCSSNIMLPESEVLTPPPQF